MNKTQRFLIKLIKTVGYMHMTDKRDFNFFMRDVEDVIKKNWLKIVEMELKENYIVRDGEGRELDPVEILEEIRNEDKTKFTWKKYLRS